jgi:hypothetical protein
LPALLAALPLLAWLTLLGVALARLHPSPPTGDALLDYVNHHLEGPRWQALGHWSLLGNETTDFAASELWPELKRTEYRDLVARFGTDPRFWMLCYVTSTPTATDQQRIQANLLGLPNQVWFLTEARRRGVADGPVLLALTLNEDQQWFDQGMYSAQYGSLRTYPYGSLYQGQFTMAQIEATRQEADKNNGPQETSLLHDLAAAMPDEALPLYLQAEVAAERGNFASALELLAAGNARPQCSGAVNGFPVTSFFPSLVGPAAPAGDLGRAWTIAPGFYYASVPEERQRVVCRALAADCARRSDWAGLDTLFVYVCRYCGKDYLPVDGHKRGVQFLQALQQGIKDAPPGRNSAQLQAARRKLDGPIKDLQAALAACQAQASPLLYYADTPLTRLLSCLTGGQSDSLEPVAGALAEDAAGHELVLQKVMPVWQKYQSLSLAPVATPLNAGSLQPVASAPR